MALEYFLLTIPFIVDQLGPVFILLSGVISLGILNHTNELTALKAGGIPLKLIIRPLLVGSALFTLLFILAAELLLPVTVAKTNNIWFEQLKGKVPLGILRNNRYHFRGEDAFYSFGWPNKKQIVFTNFSYSSWDENYNVKELITAKFADWDPDKKRYVLKHGQVQHKDENGNYLIHNFSIRLFVFKESPDDFLVPQNESAELSLSELYFATKDAKADYQSRKAWTNFLGRISYITLGLPLLLLGLPILLYSYRKWGRDLSVAIPVSCGLAFIAWGFWGALQSLSIAGYLSPILAATTLHILFSLLGFLLLLRNDR
jgi:lipopolysaccharide export system permease protein